MFILTLEKYHVGIKQGVFEIKLSNNLKRSMSHWILLIKIKVSAETYVITKLYLSQ